MTKILLKQVLRGDNGGIDWFDAILTLSTLVNNFNLSIEPTEQQEQDNVIPLCITDLLATLLFSKVDQTVEKYL